MSRANDRQVGGAHYKGQPLEHWDLAVMFGWNYLQAQAIRYLMRYDKKNGIQDLDKALHYIEKLKEVERLKEQGFPLVGRLGVAPGPADGASPGGTIGGSVPPARRTKSQVLLQRRDGHGCCERYCDNKACDCFESALDDLKGMSLDEYERLNAASRCGICRDPDCTTPNGQH